MIRYAATSERAPERRLAMSGPSNPADQHPCEQSSDPAHLVARIEDLTAQLHLVVESHRIQEMEIAAARRDLDVKAAYILMLETTHAERRAQLDSLHSHLRHLDTVAYGDLPAATARANRAENQLADQHTLLVRVEHAAAEATARASAAEAEIAAFRTRMSTVVADALGGRLRRHGHLYNSARRLLSSISRGLARQGDT